jgi:two-component system, cell cycle sensor histidine kinase and response regulator CckA
VTSRRSTSSPLSNALSGPVEEWPEPASVGDRDGRSAAASTTAPAEVPGRTSLARERDLDEIERIAHVGSWTLDPATGEATWSTEMYRILGLDPAGPPIALSDISRLFTPDSVERVGAAVERAVKSGEPWHMDLEIVRPDGAHGWVVSNGIAEPDETGAPIRIHGTMQDVTEQRRLEALLRQAQRLEAVGQLAGGIAHDFNNILTAVRGYTELVRDELDPADPHAADLDHALSAAERAAELVRQLLAFSRRQVLQPRVLDPAEVVDELVPLLRRLLGEGVELTAEAAPDLGRILVDPGQLGQVIINLAVNGRDAMPRGGMLKIEAMNAELDAAYAATHPDATPGNHVVIAVSDSGHGMDAQTQARAFEPFFTTKGPDKGTGMGLATVYGIVRQSGGSIYLYSEPGRGTTFKLYFPRTYERSEVSADLRTEGASRRANTETILLVEDDAEVRGYARRVLETAGFTVLEAATGPDAIGLAQSATVNLLLTDAVLPGMHGAELAERLVAERPGLRVLYVSGFTENSVIQHGVVAAGVHFLPKPYHAEDLVAGARDALDANT